jgi:hypothetical protein
MPPLLLLLLLLAGVTLLQLPAFGCWLLCSFLQPKSDMVQLATRYLQQGPCVVYLPVLP